MAPLSEAGWVFLGITGGFYGVLALKSFFRLSVCSICAAVSLAWLSMLALRMAGWFENDTLLALLMGMSVVGGYYVWERHAKGELLVLRLPILLTMAFIAWSVVVLSIDIGLLAVVAAVWLFHWLLFVYRNSPSIKPRVDRIIACCSNW